MTAGRYQPEDLEFIIPTKDRPGKLGNLLDSFVAQEITCARILIIDGGKSVAATVDEYADRLPVEHHVCHPPGQIRQRNMGLGMLAAGTKLVGFLDDDIVLEDGALAAMLALWNEREPETAGASFNVVNEGCAKRSVWRRWFGLGGGAPGRVLKSGNTTTIGGVNEDVRSQWLCGGATVWRREVLEDRRHREINSRWAIAEDLVFSYPVGKQFPLYVCSSARVRHEHEADYTRVQQHRFHGRTQTLWTYYFVSSNRDLSRVLFFWTLLIRSVGKTVRGVLTLRWGDIEFAAGQVEGGFMALGAWIRGRDPVSLLDEDSDTTVGGTGARGA